jgi:hypothetical protein
VRRLAKIDESDGLGLGLQLRRFDVAAGARHEFGAPERGQRLLYVIRGTGSVVTVDGECGLGPESVIWLAAGEQCTVRAGAEGLSLLAAAPA